MKVEGPCSACELNSHALMVFGGLIDALGHSARPERLMKLHAAELAVRLGGRRAGSLRRDLDGFRHGSAAARAEAIGGAVACRHQGSFAWPQRLLDDPEPPWVLHIIGAPQVAVAAEPAASAAVVGARRADGYGLTVARDLAAAVVRSGGLVISGLAWGIDAAAHEGALSVAATGTIAVVGGGADQFYPKRNAALQRAIGESGAIVSEFPFGAGVRRWTFPARNRLIAAFADAVAVVQAASGSGSLHTAAAAMERSTPVLAVPGRIDLPVSEGSNALIADGATPILRSADLVEAIGLEGSVERRLPPRLVTAARAVAEGSVGSLLDSSSGAEGRASLGELELLGVVERLADGTWRLVG